MLGFRLVSNKPKFCSLVLYNPDCCKICNALKRAAVGTKISERVTSGINERTKVREEVAFGIQPKMEYVERARFGNFALISHMAIRRSHYRACTGRNKLALRLPVASIKPVSKISPVSSRPNEKQMPRCDVRNICTHTYVHACLGCAKASSVVMRRMEIARFLFPPFSRDLALPFPVLLPRSKLWIMRIHNVSVYNYAKAANYRRIN